MTDVPATTRDGPSPGSWRGFFWRVVLAAMSPVAVVFLFVATIDPWDGLPLSPPLPRLPVTASSRHAFPMLARSPRFDSAVIGTSTARLLRPEVLDRLLGARFVNLSIDAATAYEETRLLDAFVQGHAQPRFVLLGLDHDWCDPRPEQRYHPAYAFPEWLYEPTRWAGYARIFNTYAVQEAGSQLWAILGLKPARHGLDGYNDMGVREADYDLARARANIARDGVALTPREAEGFVFTSHEHLRRALAAMPEATRKVLFFVPYTLAYQGAEGSLTRAYWAACKDRVAEMAEATPNAVVVDFMIPSPITRDESNYYDGMHYRPAVADRLAAALAAAIAGEEAEDGEYRLLLRRPALSAERARRGVKRIGGG